MTERMADATEPRGDESLADLEHEVVEAAVALGHAIGAHCRHAGKPADWSSQYAWLGSDRIGNRCKRRIRHGAGHRAWVRRTLIRRSCKLRMRCLRRTNSGEGRQHQRAGRTVERRSAGAKEHPCYLLMMNHARESDAYEETPSLLEHFP